MRAHHATRFRRQKRRLLMPWPANGSAMVALVMVLCITPLNERREPGAPALPKALQGGKAWGGFANTGKSMGQISGPVSYVYDGDTVAIGGIDLRFAKLDCEEAGTSGGSAATRRMAQLTASEKLTCTLTGKRSYDRWIGSCKLSDGRDISTVMIREGHCRHWQ